MEGINPFGERPTTCGEVKAGTTCIYPRAAYFNAQGVTSKKPTVASTGGGLASYGENINYSDKVGKKLDISLDDYFAKKQV